MVLLVGVHPMCLLVTKVSLKSLQYVFLLPKCLLSFTNECEATWILKLVTKCPHACQHNCPLITGSYIQTQNIKFPTWKCISYTWTVLNILRSWYSLLGFIQCVCLLPNCSLKAYNVLECVCLLPKCSLKASKWEATWMLVTKVSPNSRYIHIATPELIVHTCSISGKHASWTKCHMKYGDNSPLQPTWSRASICFVLV